MERTNALHADPPVGGVDLVVIDLGWTPQRQAVPAASRWLRGGEASRIITLIKPHYEASHGPEKALLRRGVLADDDAQAVAERVAGELPSFGVEVLGLTRSPIAGGSGNTEFLALLRRAGTRSE